MRTPSLGAGGNFWTLAGCSGAIVKTFVGSELAWDTSEWTGSGGEKSQVPERLGEQS